MLGRTSTNDCTALAYLACQCVKPPVSVRCRTLEAIADKLCLIVRLGEAADLTFGIPTIPASAFSDRSGSC